MDFSLLVLTIIHADVNMNLIAFTKEINWQMKMFNNKCIKCVIVKSEHP